jgi:hypothetical protein
MVTVVGVVVIVALLIGWGYFCYRFPVLGSILWLLSLLSD